jgi:glutamate N-acetyltransferase/amino-acid N-acetyltransferase
MLAFLFTDAVADGASLSEAIVRVADRTFNQASVDGDTSTNDTLVVLASGRARTVRLPGGNVAPALEEAMTLVAEELARKMVADGEGAEHLVELHVRGLATNEDAARVARTVATSSLVKTALYGQDPNWGRLLAAAGRAGAAFDPARARILIGEICIVENGIGLGAATEARAHEIMAAPSYRIDLILGDGPGLSRYLTSDLGLGYVRCNADYRT